MDKNEEMIEEITDAEEIMPDKKIEDTIVADEPLIKELEKQEDLNNDNLIIEENDNAENYEEIDEKKKNKTPLIVLLAILLVADIAALVIYIIGIDKVIEFIK